MGLTRKGIRLSAEIFFKPVTQKTMADTLNFLQNGYNGEVLEDLLTYTVQGNDTVREGLIHIKTGIQHRYTLPAVKLGNVIQDNVPTPQSTHGAKGPSA